MTASEIVDLVLRGEPTGQHYAPVEHQRREPRARPVRAPANAARCEVCGLLTGDVVNGRCFLHRQDPERPIVAFGGDYELRGSFGVIRVYAKHSNY